MLEKVFNKVKSKLDKIWSSDGSNDLECFIKDFVNLKNGDKVQIECIRCTEPLYDEDGNEVDDMVGMIVDCKIYYVRNSIEIDCCTISDLSDESLKLLKEFLYMYVD